MGQCLKHPGLSPQSLHCSWSWLPLANPRGALKDVELVEICSKADLTSLCVEAEVRELAWSLSYHFIHPLDLVHCKEQIWKCSGSHPLLFDFFLPSPKIKKDIS